jgi:hypothetical protein
METIAFYRETIIKTYGFVERTGLYLVTFDFPCERMGECGEGLTNLSFRLDASLVLMVVRPGSNNTMRFYLLLQENWTGEMPEGWPHPLFAEFPGRCRVERRVDLIHFQGPHYGDRHGIACGALDALAGGSVPILAMACSGASIFLVLPEGKANGAREALARVFMTPESN